MTAAEPLSASHPELAAQADGWDASTLTKGSNKRRAWVCSLGHHWDATVNNRTKGTGCPVCLGRRLLVGFNDLATTHRQIASEADGWDPTTVMAGSHLMRSWRCALGHIWQAMLTDRKKGTGCPFCAGVRVWPGFNDLATTHPDVAEQADGWDPALVAAGSSARLSWCCQAGHRWQSRVSHRAQGSGCPVCANKVVVPGVNDLATTHPLVADEAIGWDPIKVQAGSGRRLRWRCAEGHEWEARTYTRTNMETACPICAGRTPDVGINDLATTHPELAAQAVGWDPTTVKAASNHRARWRCAEGHEWEAIVFSRALHGRGCPNCRGRIVTPGVNDLATLYPLLAPEVRDVDPGTLHAGTKTKVWWRCDKGHEWEAAVHTRTRRLASGCPSCGTYGFDPTKNGWLYLVAHREWGLLQIGITNTPAHRVGVHESRGWEQLDLAGPMPGSDARNWESAILHALSQYPVTTALALVSQRFDGYTESWAETSFPATSLAELMQLVTPGPPPAQ